MSSGKLYDFSVLFVLLPNGTIRVYVRRPMGSSSSACDGEEDVANEAATTDPPTSHCRRVQVFVDFESSQTACCCDANDDEPVRVGLVVMELSPMIHPWTAWN